MSEALSLSVILHKWMRDLKLVKSSEGPSIGSNHFLELLIRLKKKPNLLLQKRQQDATSASNFRSVLLEVKSAFISDLKFDTESLLKEEWNEAKGKLALAILCMCCIILKDLDSPLLKALHGMPSDHQKVIERALSALNVDSEKLTDILFDEVLSCGKERCDQSPESSRGIKRKSCDWIKSPLSKFWDSPHSRILSSEKRRTAKLETVRSELRNARSENDELIKRLEELETEKKFDASRIQALESSLKSAKHDYKTLETLLVKSDGSGSEEMEEKLDRILSQLREAKDDFKAEKEFRALVESRELAANEKIEKMQLSVTKLTEERDSALRAMEEIDALSEHALSAEAELRHQVAALTEHGKKLEEELDMYHNDAQPKKSRRSPSPLEEGEDLTCVLEEKINDLTNELRNAKSEFEKVSNERAELSSKFESQVKSAAEKARFISTLTSETKRLKVDMANQRNAYDSKVANLEMRLAKATKEKNTATLALQDLHETCDEQVTKINSLEKQVAEKTALEMEIKNLKAAQKSTEEKMKIKEMESASAAHSAKEVEESDNHIHAEILSLRQSLSESDEVRQQLASELKDANNGFAQAQKQLCEVRARLAQIEEQNASDKRDLQAKIDAAQLQFEEKNGLLEQATRRLEESDEARQELISELLDTRNSYASFQEKMNTIRSAHGKEREDMQKATADLKDSLEAASSKLKEQESKINALLAELNKTREEKNEIEVEVVKIRETELQMKGEIAAVQSSLDSVRKESTDSLEDLMRLRLENQRLTNENGDLEAKISCIVGLVSDFCRSNLMGPEVGEINEKLVEIFREFARLSSELDKEKHCVEALQKSIEEFEELKRMAVEKENSSMEEIDRLVTELSNMKHQLRSTKDVLMSTRDQHQKEREQWVKANFDVQKKLDESLRVAQVDANDFTEAEEKMSSLLNALNKKNGELQDLRLELEEVRSKKLKAENELLDMQMRVDCLENEIRELETSRESQQLRDEVGDEEVDRMRSELEEVRVQLTEFQEMLEAAQCDRNRREYEREELVRANYELRQQLDEERQESDNLRSNLEAENSNLAEQVKSLETSRAELLEEIDKSNLNISRMSPEVEDLREKLNSLEADQQNAKQAFLQFAAKFKIVVSPETMNSAGFAVDFVDMFTSLMESVRTEIKNAQNENYQLKGDKKSLEKKMEELEARKDAEMKKREFDLKEFTKNRMREVSESLAMDEEKFERRIREKDEKLSKLVREKNDMAAKCERVAQKLEELRLSRDAVSRNDSNWQEEKTELLQKYADLRALHDRTMTAKRALEMKVENLNREKSVLEASAKLAEMRLAERTKSKSASSFGTHKENEYETISYGDDVENHVYANIGRPMSKSNSASTVFSRTLSCSSVRPLACEDEEGEVLTSTALSEVARTAAIQKRIEEFTNKLGTSDVGNNSVLAESGTLKKPCTKSHRRSRSLSPPSRKPLQALCGNSGNRPSPLKQNESIDLDGSTASTSSVTSNGSRRGRKSLLQTSYTKPGLPTPGKNCSVNALRSRVRKSQKRTELNNTPQSLERVLRRRSGLKAVLDGESVALVDANTRTAKNKKAQIFRNPFRGIPAMETPRSLLKVSSSRETETHDVSPDVIVWDSKATPLRSAPRRVIDRERTDSPWQSNASSAAESPVSTRSPHMTLTSLRSRSFTPRARPAGEMLDMKSLLESPVVGSDARKCSVDMMPDDDDDLLNCLDDFEMSQMADRTSVRSEVDDFESTPNEEDEDLLKCVKFLDAKEMSEGVFRKPAVVDKAPKQSRSATVDFDDDELDDETTQGMLEACLQAEASRFYSEVASTSPGIDQEFRVSEQKHQLSFFLQFQSTGGTNAKFKRVIQQRSVEIDMEQCLEAASYDTCPDVLPDALESTDDNVMLFEGTSGLKEEPILETREDSGYLGCERDSPGVLGFSSPGSTVELPSADDSPPRADYPAKQIQPSDLINDAVAYSCGSLYSCYERAAANPGSLAYQAQVKQHEYLRALEEKMTSICSSDEASSKTSEEIQSFTDEKAERDEMQKVDGGFSIFSPEHGQEEHLGTPIKMEIDFVSSDREEISSSRVECPLEVTRSSLSEHPDAISEIIAEDGGSITDTPSASSDPICKEMAFETDFIDDVKFEVDPVTVEPSHCNTPEDNIGVVPESNEYLIATLSAASSSADSASSCTSSDSGDDPNIKSAPKLVKTPKNKLFLQQLFGSSDSEDDLKVHCDDELFEDVEHEENAAESQQDVSPMDADDNETSSMSERKKRALEIFRNSLNRTSAAPEPKSAKESFSTCKKRITGPQKSGVETDDESNKALEDGEISDDNDDVLVPLPRKLASSTSTVNPVRKQRSSGKGLCGAAPPGYLPHMPTIAQAPVIPQVPILPNFLNPANPLTAGVPNPYMFPMGAFGAGKRLAALSGDLVNGGVPQATAVDPGGRNGQVCPYFEMKGDCPMGRECKFIHQMGPTRSTDASMQFLSMMQAMAMPYPMMQQLMVPRIPAMMPMPKLPRIPRELLHPMNERPRPNSRGNNSRDDWTEENNRSPEPDVDTGTTGNRSPEENPNPATRANVGILLRANHQLPLPTLRLMTALPMTAVPENYLPIECRTAIDPVEIPATRNVVTVHLTVTVDMPRKIVRKKEEGTGDLHGKDTGIDIIDGDSHARRLQHWRCILQKTVLMLRVHRVNKMRL
ncbi:unnamed protein product [Notodromas monacha]|uniref:C3H1-type domain-containing protein n=1 Tax=Notodromas monacha TaxID=399045 RepID=A0A7R9BL73_9CRUS|nr:unnamed protein product [Notodromas monacha]CAG0916745.1 unnamed protein product [Notodromas monacha]